VLSVATGIWLGLIPPDAAAEKVSALLAMPGGAYGLTVNPVTNRIYAVNPSAIAVIDGSSNAVTTIPGPRGVFARLAVNSSTNRIYATETAGNALWAIDGATHAVTIIPTGIRPSGAMVNTVTNEIYVANTLESTVTVVDGATYAAIAVPVPGYPSLIFVNELRNKAYVPNSSSPLSPGSKVTIIEGATKATTTIQVNPGTPRDMAINPRTDKVYLLQDTALVVIDGTTNAAQVIPGNGAGCLLVNPATNRIYLGCDASGRVTVVDGATHATTTVGVLAGITGPMALNPETNAIYVGYTNRPEVTVIDGATHAARSFFVGSGGQLGQVSLAINPATNTLYAAHYIVGSVAVVPIASRAVNMSTRAAVRTGDEALIAGFIIQGATPKTVVIRARGPSMPGVTSPLADPVLRLYTGQTLIAENDNWVAAANAAALQSSGFAPSDPAESALMLTLNPGAYTAVVSGASNGTGTGIVEVFEVGHTEMPFINLSARARVLTGEDVAIAGFVVQGGRPARVLVRARGPSLAAANVAGVLENPVLELRSAAGRIAVNDDWINAPNWQAIQSSGFAPADAAESAILMTLAPGAYTAILTGSANGTGTAIIEAFALD
jgi:DNA-binding beta-propeller fold protein YncE